MFNKLFNDKKFIFIFTFAIQFIVYYYFQHITGGGPFFSPELGLIPLFGLIFGPVGALGQAIGCLAVNLSLGYPVLNSSVDSAIFFIIAMLSYKLWYVKIGKREPTRVQFDSTYNLLKFIAVLTIASNVFLCFLYLSFKFINGFERVYLMSSVVNMNYYNLDMFSFALLVGLLVISVFNILQIPMQYPKKWMGTVHLKDKHLIIFFIIIITLVFFASLIGIRNPNLRTFLSAMTVIWAILVCINKKEYNIKPRTGSYTLIETIILTFLLIITITLLFYFETFEIITGIFIHENSPYPVIFTLSYVGVLIILLSMIHIHYIENTITNPIYELIDSLGTFKPSEKDSLNEYNLRFKKYLERNDDISRLINSFVLINYNIKSYLAQIRTTSKEKGRIETEFAIASKIQSNMLKTNFDEFSKDRPFEIYGFMSPSKEVGGDFYDFFNFDENNIGFVIGDVCGKGIPATLFMVKTMNLIRNHIKFDKDPEKIISNVNDLSCQRNDSGLFVTTAFGKLDLNTGKIVLVNAGHNPPLIRRNNPQDNDFEYFHVDSNFSLGIMENLSYEAQEIELIPGDTIFLYTDGITEANTNLKDFYGEKRLKETLNKYKDENLRELLEKIKDDVDDFLKSKDQFDDVTMLIIKYNGCENNG